MLRSKPLAFIDVETTGLEAGYHEIIEICIHTQEEIPQTLIPRPILTLQD